MATAAKSKTTATYAPRLKSLYNDTYRKELQKELGIENINDVPRLNKITINIGLGRAKDDKKLLEVANNTLTKITGQKPVS